MSRFADTAWCVIHSAAMAMLAAVLVALVLSASNADAHNSGKAKHGDGKGMRISEHALKHCDNPIGADWWAGCLNAERIIMEREHYREMREMLRQGLDRLRDNDMRRNRRTETGGMTNGSL